MEKERNEVHEELSAETDLPSAHEPEEPAPGGGDREGRNYRWSTACQRRPLTNFAVFSHALRNSGRNPPGHVGRPRPDHRTCKNPLAAFIAVKDKV